VFTQWSIASCWPRARTGNYLRGCPAGKSGYRAGNQRKASARKSAFHQLNKNTGNRVRYRKVDEETGDEVEQPTS